MKKVFNFFSRSEDEPGDTATTYRPKEPTLRPAPTVHPQPARPLPPGSSSRYGGVGTQGARPSPAQPDNAARAAQADAASQPAVQPAARGRAAPEGAAARHPAASEPQRKPAQEAEAIPTGYAELVEYFRHTVAARKSPYNALVQAADRLKDFIPNETGRLQAALAICGDRWTPDALSLAISAHVSDIELACRKVHSNAHAFAAEHAGTLRAEAGELREGNAKLRSEIAELQERIGKLEAAVHDNDGRIATLDEQIRLAEAGINSPGFADQAAENLKNDLLAKKVILGLP